MLTRSGFEGATRAAVASFVARYEGNVEPDSPVPPIQGHDDDPTGDNPCTWAQSHLSAYMDHEMDATGYRAMTSHLNQCKRCADYHNSLIRINSVLEREWRDTTPLPSSLEFKRGVQNIMAALPPVPVSRDSFPHRRTHARMRWMRIAAAGGAMVLLVGLVGWSLRPDRRTQVARQRTSTSVPGPRSLQHAPASPSAPLISTAPDRSAIRRR